MYKVLAASLVIISAILLIVLVYLDGDIVLGIVALWVNQGALMVMIETQDIREVKRENN